MSEARGDHIIHVGFHKTASTWLQRHVFPSVSGATPAAGNEVIYALMRNLTLDDVFLEEALNAALRALGPRVLISHEALIGSPWIGQGLVADRRADRLLAVAPHARILIVRRDPKALRRSLYAQYVNEGGPGSIDDFERDVLSEAYIDLDRCINIYRQRWERVKVLSYETILANPAKAITEIEAFADVSFTVPTVVKHENPSLTGWRLSVLRAWNRWFRESAFNPTPLVTVPGAHGMRLLLQALESQRRGN